MVRVPSPPSPGERTPLLPPASAAASAATTRATATRERRHEIRVLATASLLTTFFFFVELFGGYIAGSLAVMSDAAHLLSDLAGFVISLLALKIASLPANAFLSFGFARAEVLGAFVSILCIWILTAALVVCACYRLVKPEIVNGPLMLVLGVIGLGVNFLLGFVLSSSQSTHTHLHDHGDGGCPGHEVGAGTEHDHGSHTDKHDHGAEGTGHDSHSGHSHDGEKDFLRAISANGHAHEHNHAEGACGELGSIEGSGNDDGGGLSHDVEAAMLSSLPASIVVPVEYSWRWVRAKIAGVFTGEGIRSINVRAAYLHALGDALQSIGVIFAAVILTLKPAWSWVDPLCTLFFAGLVLLTTKGIATDTFAVLMEGTPPKLSLNEVYTALMSIKDVKSIGDLHVWSITADRPALSAHIFAAKNDGTGKLSHEIMKTAEALLHDRFGIDHATIQVNCDEADCCDDTTNNVNINQCVSTSSLQTFDE